MALTRAQIITNILAMMALNEAETTPSPAQTRFAETMADQIIDGSTSPVFADASEVNAGTDNTKVISPLALNDSKYNLIKAYQSGSYNTFNWTYGTVSTTPLVPNRLEGAVIRVETPVVVTAARLRINSAVAGDAIVGIYRYSQVTNSWTLIEQTPAGSPFNLGSASTQEVSFASPVALSVGIYCAAILANSNASVFGIIRDAGVSYFGHSGTIGTTSDLSNAFFNTTYATTLPSSPSFTLTSRSGGFNPLILFKVQ